MKNKNTYKTIGTLSLVIIGISILYLNLSYKEVNLDKLYRYPNKYLDTNDSQFNLEKNPKLILKKTIDIYLSAGENTTDSNGKTIKSCNRNNNWNCGIYKVTWDFINNRPISYKLIFDSIDDGDISPNVSPNEKFIAFSSSLNETDDEVTMKDDPLF